MFAERGVVARKTPRPGKCLVGLDAPACAGPAVHAASSKTDIVVFLTATGSPARSRASIAASSASNGCDGHDLDRMGSLVSVDSRQILQIELTSGMRYTGQALPHPPLGGCGHSAGRR